MPFVIHFFVPEMTHLSPSRTAVVCSPATSLPGYWHQSHIPRHKGGRLTCKCLRDGQADDLFTRQDVGQDLVLQLLGSEVEDGRDTNNILRHNFSNGWSTCSQTTHASQAAVDEPTSSESSELLLEDQLEEGMRNADTRKRGSHETES
jgi:hypothetical protein